MANPFCHIPRRNLLPVLLSAQQEIHEFVIQFCTKQHHVLACCNASRGLAIRQMEHGISANILENLNPNKGGVPHGFRCAFGLIGAKFSFFALA